MCVRAAGATLNGQWEPACSGSRLKCEPNAVWRFGRLFLRCPTCRRLITRVYVPTTPAPARCRVCWGLTYESRQHRPYKDSGLLAVAGLTLRWFAQSETLRERECRAEAARQRYAERRAIVTNTKAT